MKLVEDKNTGIITLSDFGVEETVHNISEIYSQIKNLEIDDKKTAGVRLAKFNKKNYKAATTTNGVTGPIVYREDGSAFEGKELIELKLIPITEKEVKEFKDAQALKDNPVV